MRARCHLVIMAKQPVLGRVKTRLARSVGAVEATRAYRVMLAQCLRRLAGDGRWTTWIAVTPDGAVAPAWWQGGASIRLIGQGPGDLGQRMQSILDRLPPGPAAIVGSDVPDVRPADIAAAFRALAGHDAVLGPASDGGYWLVGFARRRPLRAFINVRWSTADALADTLANLADRRVAMLRHLADVDTEADHRAWRRVMPATPPVGQRRGRAP